MEWETDAYLTFTPKHDWEVGRDYSVTLARDLFGPQVLLRSYSFQFRSPAFEDSIGAAQFYQDPTDPKINQVVATIVFTHPVDKSDFENHVALEMRVQPPKGSQAGPAKSFGFKVSYDKPGGKAFVHIGRSRRFTELDAHPWSLERFELRASLPPVR